MSATDVKKQGLYEPTVIPLSSGDGIRKLVGSADPMGTNSNATSVMLYNSIGQDKNPLKIIYDPNLVCILQSTM